MTAQVTDVARLLAFAACLAAAGCAGTADEKNALLSILANEERCSSVADGVDTSWEGGLTAIQTYYAEDGAAGLAAAQEGLQAAEDAMGKISGRSDEARGLLLELFAEHSKLCHLAFEPQGHSRLTYLVSRL